MRAATAERMKFSSVCLKAAAWRGGGAPETGPQRFVWVLNG